MSEKIKKLEDFVREKWVLDFKLVKMKMSHGHHFRNNLIKLKLQLFLLEGVYIKGEPLLPIIMVWVIHHIVKFLLIRLYTG
ncbi:hypothetical protein A361_15745 [Cytobacillus oceanisediminis 2691]|uniref:Uncharacterized protein n=1 Tax=Cytobacillus oceanisediminis 2691 TaxID=1196031 RepID=A0A160MC58_9BACI|nr:hypothetical protein A361_15745 [Cytobacillus oceanisediminis 2691]